MKEQIKWIAEYYGYDFQARQCCEELAELIQAICKHNKMVDGDDYFESTDTPQRLNVLEEMADSMVMILQMMYFLKIDETDLKDEMYSKIKRQLMRIQELEDSE